MALIFSPDSFENVKAKWYPEVRHHCPDVPIILVGTKKDLRDAYNRCSNESSDSNKSSFKEDKRFSTLRRKTHLRKSSSVSSMQRAQSIQSIDEEMAKALSNELYNVYSYVECSAKTGEGVKEVFEEGIRAVIKPKVEVIKPRTSCVIV